MNKGSRHSKAKQAALEAVFQDVRTEMVEAFKLLGGRRWLVKLGREDKKAFASLLSKLLPQEITGKNGSPLLGDVQLQQITNNILAMPTAELEKLNEWFVKLGVTLALPGGNGG